MYRAPRGVNFGGCWPPSACSAVRTCTADDDATRRSSHVPDDRPHPAGKVRVAGHSTSGAARLVLPRRSWELAACCWHHLDVHARVKAARRSGPRLFVAVRTHRGLAREVSILVAGAGLAGLTVALTLAEAGHRVRVIEKHGLGVPAGGVRVPPNASKLLAHWVPREDLLRIGVPLRRLRPAESLRDGGGAETPYDARIEGAVARTRSKARTCEIWIGELISATICLADMIILDPGPPP
ncbi:hypothetical protein FOMPIDRAFT_1049800 [Fomitopsis schrenkii]|uniref:FAD-dependent oxidoreductase 2 FAD-binding domain-containing protein n=1 Tax=Fomitopsis schrenkii TaxID=2126942 RepID=S8E739_FOMSC|nr:hypothetical protein FOMPIDRAFT_1049800 [Fomitopsis schrenkii]